MKRSAFQAFNRPALLTPEAAAKLLDLLINAGFSVRQKAANALEVIDPSNLDLVPLMGAHLKDKIAVLIRILKTVRVPADIRAVAALLATLGPAARPAIPVLEQVRAQRSGYHYLADDLTLAIKRIQGD